MAANRRHESTNRNWTWRNFLLPVSGQVLVCTLTERVVNLDLVADDGALPAGTPFVVVAVIPTDTVHALVAPVLGRWMEERGLVTAEVTCHHGLGRVMVEGSRTRVNLDVRSMAVPRLGAAA